MPSPLALTWQLSITEARSAARTALATLPSRSQGIAHAERGRDTSAATTRPGVSISAAGDRRDGDD
jgi:hypothetical protein